MERQGAKEWHAKTLSLVTRPAMTEDVGAMPAFWAKEVAHVLDDAEHRHIHALEHVKPLARIDEREVLRRRDDDRGGSTISDGDDRRGHALSVTKQAEAAGIARSTVYYLPRPVSSADLELMRQIDRLHLEFTFAGARMLRGLLAANGSKTGRRRVKTLMKRMGDRGALPPSMHDEARAGAQGLPVSAARHGGRAAKGFVYLAVVLDWFSRRVLSWRVSITMEASFCVETLKNALARHGRPEIFNTDQGSQFTGAAFTSVLVKNDIAISMDGRGAWRDNVFVERLWRSVKACRTRAPRSGGTSPDQAYYGAHSLPPIRLAA